MRVTLTYTACGHRYAPKASADWRDWTPLVTATDEDGNASFEIAVGPDPIYVASQEILPAATYESWIDALDASGVAESLSIGASAQGRPLRALAIGNPTARDVVLVLGRQHPPEVSGAKGLFAFVQTLVGEDPGVADYRANVFTLVVPLLNPDGVEAGHWRHNTGGTDLNRDWGAYTQPETRAVRDLIERYRAEGRRLTLVLDFHSTSRNVLYTLPEEAETDPPRLVDDWIAALHRRTPDFTFDLAPGYRAGSGVAKNVFFERYGVPAVTVEFGDDTDRNAIAREGQAAALALAEVMAARR